AALGGAHKICRTSAGSAPKSRARLPACSSTKSASRLRCNLVNRDNRASLLQPGGVLANCATAADAADRNSDKSAADLRYEFTRPLGRGARPRDSRFADDLE